MMKMMLRSLLVVVASVVVVVQAQQANLDQFTYGETDTSGDNSIYGPEQWSRVRCANLDDCLGWPDSWKTGIEWELEENYCNWCPMEREGACGTHHQSPINLERNRAIEGHEMWKECIDKHWMAYHDSPCDFPELQSKNAFSIERHALKITQPLVDLGNDEYKLDCGASELFGQIDFSKGFSQWWHLSHTDVHVPSEHTQEGKRYDGEIHLYHFYSVNAEVAGTHNEMASVTIFLQAYDNQGDYDVLNKIICEWRRMEEQTREQCGLPSVEPEYPGCYYYQRGHGNNTDVISQQSLGGRRNLRRKAAKEAPQRPLSVHDVIMHNYKHSRHNATFKPKRVIMDPANFEDPDPDFDWDAFIAAELARDHYGENENNDKDHRRLLNYDHVDWFNYWPLLGVRTEYYYRYSGTQTVPPCYGQFFQGNDRRQTNHWRVMKDPLRISRRQLNELHRLLKDRIAPISDPLRPCQPDTAAKPHPDEPDSKVWVARPLQSFRPVHYETFCECQDWGSKWPEDREWCRMQQLDRYYDHPYNFATRGF